MVVYTRKWTTIFNFVDSIYTKTDKIQPIPILSFAFPAIRTQKLDYSKCIFYILVTEYKLQKNIHGILRILDRW